MIKKSDEHKKYFFSVEVNGEKFLVRVACEYEYDVMIICSECGKRDVIKCDKIFDRIVGILPNRRGNGIRRWDILPEIEEQVKKIFARQLCYLCYEEEERIKTLANKPTNPLQI